MIRKYEHNIISAQDPFEIGLAAWLLARKYKLKLQIQIHGDFLALYIGTEKVFEQIKILFRKIFN